MSHRFLLFIGVLLLALAGMSLYVYRRAARVMGLGRRGRWALAAALAVGMLAMITGHSFGRYLGDSAAAAIAAAGFTLELAVIISAALLLLVDIVRGVLELGGKLAHWVRRGGNRAPGDTPSLAQADPADPSDPPDLAAARPPSLTRRELLVRSALGVPLLIGPGTSLYGVLVGRHAYRTEDLPVRLPGLSRRLDGYTIVQISDIHFGLFVRERDLKAAVELVGRAKPDLIAITGDLVDHEARYAPEAGRLVHALAPLARDGVVVIPGNHDYYAGIDAVLGSARRGGARVLRNQGRVIGDRGGAFSLLGVDDVSGYRYPPSRGADLGLALSMVPGDLPRVLLCHNPVFFPRAAHAVQLQLSGHTHGGQVNVGGPLLADLVLPYGYVAGRYERAGSLLYVNRGFGTAGPPARIDAPPEVTRVILTS